jgi:hypothetical protein
MTQISALCIHAHTEIDNDILSVFSSISDIDKSANLKLFTVLYDLNISPKNFSVLPIYESKYSYNDILVWDLLSLELVIDFPNIKRVFYIQDNNIPWYMNNTVPYSTWSRLFGNDKVTIISTNKTISDIFNLTYKECKLLETISAEKLYEILR